MATPQTVALNKMSTLHNVNSRHVQEYKQLNENPFRFVWILALFTVITQVYKVLTIKNNVYIH